MKKVILVVVIAVVLTACAGLPEPESPTNCLVMGRFIMDFPDKFFDKPATTITNNIVLKIFNITKKELFTVRTASGWYYFLSNGSDKYMLATYSYKKESSSGSVEIGEKEIKKTIETSPGKLVYVGDITDIYKSPDKTGSRGGDALKLYSFKISRQEKWDKAALVQYLRDNYPDSHWLGVSIVEYGKP